MKSRLVSLAAVFLAMAMISENCLAQRVLMLVDPAAGWHADVDLELADFLEADGYDVTIQPVAELPGEDQLDEANDFDVVYIADSLGSTSVHDGTDMYLKDSPTPVISQEAYMWDEAAWTGRVQFEDFGDTFQAVEDGVLGAFTALDIANAAHPMASGLSGAVDVFTDPYGYNYGFIPEMGAGVDVIATVSDNPDYATLFVYEAGAILADDTESAGMRIGMYLGQNVVSEDFGGDGTNNRWDRLTENGMLLVKAAFDYATGKIGLTPGDYNGNGVLDAEDLDVHAEYVRTSNLAGDVDGDGDVETSDRYAWIEQLQGSWVGDSNFDGEFNSSDFVAVFGDGKYETGAAATYAEGDWNGNGFFDSGDFVAAFSAGGYERGPRAAAAAVPEPHTALLSMIGLLSVAISRRGALNSNA